MIFGKRKPFKARPEILFHPNIPKPLHGVAPRVVMGKEWWDMERRKSYASTGFLCAACGVSSEDALFFKHLEAHELYEIDYARGRMVFKETVPLCHACHNFIHSGRMQALVDNGKMLPSKQKKILIHGNSILKPIEHLRPATPAECEEWGRWRLVFNGKEYKPKHKSLAAWMKFYASPQEEIEDEDLMTVL